MSQQNGDNSQTRHSAPQKEITITKKNKAKVAVVNKLLSGGQITKIIIPQTNILHSISLITAKQKIIVRVCFLPQTNKIQGNHTNNQVVMKIVVIAVMKIS
jgi:hypothetical protein